MLLQSTGNCFSRLPALGLKYDCDQQHGLTFLVDVSQATVFKDLGEDVLKNAWEGYNATLFAYGQTGSGKSYSMLGFGPNRGIIPLACCKLFEAIGTVGKNSGKEFQVGFVNEPDNWLLLTCST